MENCGFGWEFCVFRKLVRCSTKACRNSCLWSADSKKPGRRLASEARDFDALIWVSEAWASSWNRFAIVLCWAITGRQVVGT